MDSEKKKRKFVWLELAAIAVFVIIAIVVSQQVSDEPKEYQAENLYFENEPETVIDEVPAPIVPGEEVYDIAEVEPSFPGGPEEMTKWIQKKVQYPIEAAEMGEQGIVYVKFIVNTDGSVVNAEVRKGVSESLDNEALRVVKMMPKWIPGEQDGKKVRVSFTLPISFKLG
jgi:TonB family protein